MDPVAFRLSMLDGTPRLKAALKLVAEKSGWGSPLPARVGRGVSAQPSFGSFIATVVEAEVDDVGGVHLRRVTCAVDTGIAVNPDTIMAQLQGGLIFGLTAALWGEVTLEKGRVQQSNFNDYRMLRIDETPPIDVHVIKSADIPAASVRLALPPGRPLCATRSMRQPVCRCGACRSTAPRLPLKRRNHHAPHRHDRHRRYHSRSHRCFRLAHISIQDRSHLLAARQLPLPTIIRPIRPASRPVSPRPTSSNAANISRGLRTAWSATLRLATQSTLVVLLSRCHSARSIRPTSPPTKYRHR